MKLNPKIAKKPEDLQNLEFKKMKAIMKKELKRLQKYTSKEKPTQCIMLGAHAYTDKPDMALPLFGKWQGKFKQYAKKEVVKDPMGAIGSVYFDGIDEQSGQKVVKIQLAKGKGKKKVNKIQRTLKKLIPQASYNVIFSEISEAELDGLEQKLDQEVDQEENFEEPDYADKGEIDVEAEGLNLKKLLTSNLKEIATTLKDIKATVLPKAKDRTLLESDVDRVVNLLDLCEEWQEIYDEASIFSWTKATFLASRAKVELIQHQLEGYIEKLRKIAKADPVEADDNDDDQVNDNQTGGLSDDNQQQDDNPQNSDDQTADDGQTNVVDDNQTYNTAFEAQEIAKEMHKEKHFWPGYAFIPFTGKSGKKYKKGDKIDAGDGNPTWCNQFAYELGDRVLGEANPFNMLPMGEGWTNANTLTQWMEKADGVLVDKITGEGRFAKAWEQINKGKMVYFCHNNEGGIGHVATGAPTPQLRESSKVPGDMVGKVTQAGAKVGELWIDEVWGKSSLGELGIYVGRFQEPLPNNEKPDPNLHLAIYNKITHPIGQGKVTGNVGSLHGNYSPSELQDVIASIRTVQQLLVNAGQSVGSKGVDGDAGGSTIQALKNIQAELGIEQTGYVEYGDATWNYLWDKSKGAVEAALDSTTQQLPPPIQAQDIKFQFKGSAAGLSAKAEEVLRDILAKAAEGEVAIVNTLRSAEEQASVMYANIQAYGAEFNRTQYKTPSAASQVVDAYEAAVAAGKGEQEVIGAMLAVINQVGAASLSDHCNSSNPAIDIHPASIKNKSNFEKVIKADGRVTVICPPKDTTYHIVVK
jgi:peptidoglycan hydrolase-like protein with peptidoglycan-binding domain/ribosomal protein L36